MFSCFALHYFNHFCLAAFVARIKPDVLHNGLNFFLEENSYFHATDFSWGIYAKFIQLKYTTEEICCGIMEMY